MHTPDLTFDALLYPLLDDAESVTRVLPDERFAGTTVVELAGAWGPLASTAFVRVRRLDTRRSFVSVLRFDDWGFGKVTTVAHTPCGRFSHVAAELSTADRIVVVAPTVDFEEILGVSPTDVELRSAEQLRFHETEALQIVRMDRDAHPDVWERFATGDLCARGIVDEAARADLMALISLGGAELSLH